MNTLTLSINMDELFELNHAYGQTPQAYMDYLLSKHRATIVDWLDKACGERDWNEYEGGIDSWWGLGSVFGYELGLEWVMKVPASTQRIDFIFTA